MRSEPVNVRSLFRLDSSVLSAFAIALSMNAIPHALHTARSMLKPILGGRMMIAQFICYAICFYILYRTIAWLPLIVDRHLSVKSALLLAIDATRNQSHVMMAVFVIFLLMGIPVGALFMLAAKFSGALVLVRLSAFTIGTLVCCSIYEFLLPSSNCCHDA